MKVLHVDSDQEPTTAFTFKSGVIVIRWSPDGKRLAASSQDGTVVILDPDNSDRELILGNHTGHAKDLAWSPDGRRLATCSSDRTIKIWDTTSGVQTLSFEAHDVSVMCLAWSPDGKQLVSAGGDGLIKFWDASLGYERAESNE